MKKEDILRLKQAIAFAILMEGNGGVLNKAPSYVLEKFQVIRKTEYPEGFLDVNNKRIFNEYIKRWRVD